MDELLDALKKLSREGQVVLGGLVLFLILSFFDWQQVSGFGVTVGKNLWNGFGIIVILVAIVFLVWEVLRLLERAPNLGQFEPPIVSAALALILVVFTVIVFLDWSQYRHWPEWLGTIVAIVIAVASFLRARSEGVEVPKMPANVSMGSGGGAAAATAAPPPAAPEPPAPAEETGGGETSEA
jgi:hypothetical protein